MELSRDIMEYGKESIPLPTLSTLNDKLVGRRRLDGAEIMKLWECNNTVEYYNIRKDTLGLLESGKCVFVPNRGYADLLFSVGIISQSDLQEGLLLYILNVTMPSKMTLMRSNAYSTCELLRISTLISTGKNRIEN